ncbi:MAG: DUF1934 domain-containing protein [Clostridia bacterium]|nr:DUF1934 domain-containing protein [Clostridia bacterium]
MIKDVIIDIKGVQGIDENTDTIEFTTDGRFGFKDGEYYIAYDEGQLFDNGEKVNTKLFIKANDSVILQRNGALKSKMVIEKGKRNTCFYSTVAGDLVIGIFGEAVDYDFTEKGGSINLKYTIDSDLRVISRNSVNILIREVN